MYKYSNSTKSNLNVWIISLREDEFHIWWAETRQVSIKIMNKVLYIEKLPPFNSRSASFPSLFLTLLYGLWHLSRRPLLLVISPTITGAIFQSLEFIRAITRIKATHRSAIFNLRQVSCFMIKVAMPQFENPPTLSF